MSEIFETTPDEKRPTVDYQAPEMKATVPVPSSEELQGAKWFTIGFFVVVIALTVIGVVAIVSVYRSGLAD